MGIVGQLVELKRQEALEEGRREGLEEATRQFIENLFKKSELPLEKIASLAEVSLEIVKRISVMSVVEELARIKRHEVLEECRASYYCEDYSKRYVRQYIKSYEIGLQDGVELVSRRFVEGLLNISSYSIEDVAALAEVSVEKVKKIKEAL